MRVGIHQPQYLPWLPYLRKAAKCDLFILLDSVAFQKNGLQNRNRIKGASGPLWLTVPVRHELGQAIRDTRIDNRSNWRRKHWTTLQQHYARTPGFAAHGAELGTLYEREWDNLCDLNLAALRLLFRWYGVRVELARSSEMEARGKGSELVLNLCREAGATTYLSGLGGKDYLDEASFSRAGIELVYEPPEVVAPYPQAHPDAGFVGDLSAIDLLFNCGDDWPRYLNQEITTDAR
ncbi:MAG: WbqC family protein [Gemmatimonadales bacterium]